jgi:chromosome segregation ATPase
VQEKASRDGLRQAEDESLRKERAAVARALEGCVPSHELTAAHNLTALAERRVDQLQAANDELSAQAHILSQELVRAQNECAEMRNTQEMSMMAVSCLEDTLQKIEKRVNRSDAIQHVSQEDTQLATLARQIVTAKLAEADAQRKLKASVRHELEHRQRIAEQAERISSLKETVKSLRDEISQGKCAMRAQRVQLPICGGDQERQHGVVYTAHRADRSRGRRACSLARAEAQLALHVRLSSTSDMLPHKHPNLSANMRAES